MEMYKEAQREGQPFEPAAFGFEITLQQIRQKIAFYELQRNGCSAAIAEIRSKQAA